MRRILKAALWAVGMAMISSGCVSTLAVRAVQPARVNFGAAKQLVIVQSEGRRSAREEILAEIERQARNAGHFIASDRTEQGIVMRAAGRTVTVSNSPTPQPADEVWVRVDVLEWTANEARRTEPVYNDKGVKVGEKEIVFIRGKTLLAVTAANAQGRAMLAETEYEAFGEADTEESARVQAGRLAVSKFLRDITPVQVTRNVRLDEDDKGQEKILKLAKDGNLNAAITEMRAYLQANPTNPTAQYNLAVFLDAAGSYPEALDMYNSALRGSTKDYYAGMKADCQKRLDDAMALAH